MAKTLVKEPLVKGARITGAQRDSLAKTFARRYASGDSVRRIAEDSGRSFGFVHGVLKESGATFRGRGGATRGVRKPPAATKTSPPKKAAPQKKAAPPKKAAAKKTAVKAPAKRASKKG